MASAPRKRTLGEVRARVGHHPHPDVRIDEVRKKTAAMIDHVEAHRPAPEVKQPEAGEVHRMVSLAQTHLEDALMWAERAITHPVGLD